MRRFGVLSILLIMAGCFPYGFAGGGLPSHVRTVAVIPFENLTSAPEIQQELALALRTELRNRLGLREAAESRASAIVRGTIQRYETDIPIGFSAANKNQTSARRQLQISVDIEMVDQVSGKSLWQRKGLIAEGQYEERGEATGRKQAIERIVNEVIQGAQSQW
ncbi:MAG: LPS assembly lipoprotein LptE [Gemmatimonadales bacterium]